MVRIYKRFRCSILSALPSQYLEVQVCIDHPYYKIGEEIGKNELPNLIYFTVTGGGPGPNGSSEQGAFESGGKSIGINIYFHLNR